MMTKLPILRCAEKLELVLSTAPTDIADITLASQAFASDVYVSAMHVHNDYHGGHLFRTRAHHGDEIPERDVTCHLTCLLIYH